MSRELMARLAAAAACGATCAWLAPPASLTWIHWVAYVPALWALRDRDPWRNVLVGWTFSAFALAFIFRWLADTISIYSNITEPIAALIILFGAFVLFGWLYVPAFVLARPLRAALGDGWVVGFATVLVANELISGFVNIFPWQIGTGHYRNATYWQLVSVTGVWGISWLLALTNAVGAEVVYRRAEGRPFPTRLVVGAVGLLVAVSAWGAWRAGRVEAILAEAPVVRVAQLQSPHDMRYRMEQQGRREALQEWVDRTLRLPRGSVDLVVWPESAISYPDVDRGPVHDLIRQLTREGGYEMVVGGGARARIPDPVTGEVSDEQFNSVFFFDEEGVVRGRYDKMMPLIFGEYLPWWLAWLHHYVVGIGDFRAGTEAVVFEGRHARMASPICYEAIFGRVCRRWGEIDLIVTGTNDAWFGDTAAPHQHAMLAAIRATELGVPVFRSAYSGISMLVEPHGRIVAETEPFTEVARVVEVRLARIPTLYARFGDWFAWACLAVSLALGAVLAVPRGLAGWRPPG